MRANNIQQIEFLKLRLLITVCVCVCFFQVFPMELSQCQGNNNLLVSTSYRAHVDFRKSELKAWQGSSKS